MSLFALLGREGDDELEGLQPANDEGEDDLLAELEDALGGDAGACCLAPTEYPLGARADASAGAPSVPASLEVQGAAHAGGSAPGSPGDTEDDDDSDVDDIMDEGPLGQQLPTHAAADDDDESDGEAGPSGRETESLAQFTDRMKEREACVSAKLRRHPPRVPALTALLRPRV